MARGDAAGVEFFQWHSDTFALPADARRLLTGTWCANQAYLIERPGYAHVGMQFHIEMTPELVRRWAADPVAAHEVDAERRRTGGPAVQSPETWSIVSKCGRPECIGWRHTFMTAGCAALRD